MATAAELKTTILNQLAIVAAADPSTYVDYKIGNKTVSKSQYVKHLLAMMKQLDEIADSEISVMTFDIDNVDEFGEDHSEYEL